LPLSLSRFYQTRDTTANGDLMGHGRTYMLNPKLTPSVITKF
jgi:hypothetical protein